MVIKPLRNQHGLQSLAQIFRTWWPVFAALIIIQVGNGLTSSLVSVSGEAAGLSPGLKGLILSAFYLGSVAGALTAPRLIGRASHVVSFLTFTSVLAISTAGLALSDDPVLWIALRLIAGASLTGMFATVESWLNLGASDRWRARVFSIYIFMQLGGLAAGQLALNARSFGNETLFLCAAALTLLAMALMRFERARSPKLDVTHHVAVWTLARRAPIGVLCVALAGFSWAGLMASGPALVEMMGFDDFYKSMILALTVTSGMLAQIPVGWMADHFDRRKVLAAMTAVAGASAIVAALVTGIESVFLFFIVFGGATFPLYAVGVACTNDDLVQSERTSASAAMIIFFELGAIIAPLMLAFATAFAGPKAYFIVQAFPQLLFMLAVVVALRRPQVPSL